MAAVTVIETELLAQPIQEAEAEAAVLIRL
jgi:hypothetical protein